MKILSSRYPTRPDQLGALAALERAARRAREIARQTHTPCYIVRDGRVVDVSREEPSPNGEHGAITP
jgi:hypothetical protein